MAAARCPNQIMEMFARKKQKVAAATEPAEKRDSVKQADEGIAEQAEEGMAKQAEEGMAKQAEEVIAKQAEEGIEGQAAPTTYSTYATYPFPIADLLPSAERALAPASAPKVIKRGDLDLLYFQSFFKPSVATLVYKHLLDSLPWYKVAYLARGMTIHTPRYTTVFGLDETAVFAPEDELENGVRVRASTVLSAVSKQPVPANVYHSPPRPIPGCLLALKRCVEHATGESYNFVLVNFYADGTHSISPHSDDESFLGHNPCVASLSLGGTRDFVMKHKTKKEASGEKFALRNGDLVVMRGTTMANWLHGIPKRAGKTQSTSPRINVTFRKVLNAKGSNNYAHYNVGSGPVHRFVQGSMVPSLNPETLKP